MHLFSRTHSAVIRTEIPGNLSDGQVLHFLHHHPNIIVQQAFVTHYSEDDDADTAPDGIAATDKGIPIIPGPETESDPNVINNEGAEEQRSWGRKPRTRTVTSSSGSTTGTTTAPLGPGQKPSSLDDANFQRSTPIDRIKSYTVHELIHLLPKNFLTKKLSFPVHFQNTVDGVISRAIAPGGVTVRAQWSITRDEGLDRQQAQAHSDVGNRDRGNNPYGMTQHSQTTGPDTYLDGSLSSSSTRLPQSMNDPSTRPQQPLQQPKFFLREDIQADCSPFLMWFVAKSMRAAHQDICNKILNCVHQDVHGVPCPVLPTATTS